MGEIVEMQTANCSNLDPSKLCSFDLEVIDAPTSPLIHQAARFLFITGGRGVIRLQNADYPLRPGTLVSILPWQISDITQVAEPLQFYIVVYRFDIVNEIIKSFYNTDNSPVEIVAALSARPVVDCSESQRDRVRGVFLSLRGEVGIESTMTQTEPQMLSGIYITNQLVELVILFLRIGSGGDTAAGNAPPRIDRSEILRYMYNHLSEKLTLKRLSQLFYMSESSISQYITQMTGLSFFDLLNEMRVGKTINFLLYTDFTMEELAELLGYVDAAHISKVFAARVGLKASEYRRTYQKVSEICKVKESKKAYRLLDYIYRSYAEDLTPQKVANKFGMSVQELHKTLMYQVEKNFEDLLHFVRINRACLLLLQTDMSVLDIAMQVGYNSQKTFTRNFLKQRVMTPSAFRKQVALQPTSLKTDDSFG